MDEFVTTSEMVERIKQLAKNHIDGKVFDNHVAGLLRMSDMTLATVKKRDKPPLKEIIMFYHRTGVDPMKILF